MRARLAQAIDVIMQAIADHCHCAAHVGLACLKKVHICQFELQQEQAIFVDSRPKPHPSAQLPPPQLLQQMLPLQPSQLHKLLLNLASTANAAAVELLQHMPLPLQQMLPPLPPVHHTRLLPLLLLTPLLPPHLPPLLHRCHCHRHCSYASPCINCFDWATVCAYEQEVAIIGGEVEDGDVRLGHDRGEEADHPGNLPG